MLTSIIIVLVIYLVSLISYISDRELSIFAKFNEGEPPGPRRSFAEFATSPTEEQ